MAKQQRSTLLPPDMLRLTEAFESVSGVKFNRQVLAALLQYFCANPLPDSVWIGLAVAVEKGQLEVGEAMVEFANYRVKQAHSDVQFWEHLVSTGKANKAAVLPYYHAKREAHARLRRIRKIMDWANEPLAAIIAEWKDCYGREDARTLGEQSTDDPGTAT